ncbi:glycosyltransferase, partial [Rhodoferax sp.]|uniref:glycosyltransferase n=1 Tax=Rhodoferax sp. TaxID=50421 RepID=UPI00345B873F|nr:sugar transferase [Gammaproteobacteria bacterium]
ANPQGMAYRLVELACDAQRARDMGQAGRQRAQSNFSMQAMVSTYQSLYDQQLRRRGPVPATLQHQ